MEFFIIHVLETGTMQGSRVLSGLMLFRKQHLLIDLSKSTSIALHWIVTYVTESIVNISFYFGLIKQAFTFIILVYLQ